MLENERTTTVFRADGSDSRHIRYRSVYPDSSMADAFDRVSPTHYTLHFTQTANGKTIASADSCTKLSR